MAEVLMIIQELQDQETLPQSVHLKVILADQEEQQHLLHLQHQVLDLVAAVELEELVVLWTQEPAEALVDLEDRDLMLHQWIQH